MILLVGINARYAHTSIGLRYLYANLKELQEKTKILEFVINEDIPSLVEKILQEKPKIVGIGVYIWNASDVSEMVKIIKKVSPSTRIILGGPEVSHQPFRVNFDKADFIIQGEGEVSFYTLCKEILQKEEPKERIISAVMPELKELVLPYAYYTDHDVQNRIMYVESSRGCPYACEFCLSAIDERVRNFDMDVLLDAFEVLWQRGARSFKFIDRTFNLNIKLANRLIDFFLAHEPTYSLHFEVIPDNFPQKLKERIVNFPKGALQLEVGIQSLNNTTLANINRKMNLEKVKENIAFLENETNAHLHVDLIVGLPGESLREFGDNLNQLMKITSSEIQIGILKKLSGTTLNRHDEMYGMVYSDKPPYDILQNNLIPYAKMQEMKRFARFWDLTYNSGNFHKTIQYMFKGDDAYQGFYDFSQWIYGQTESTWQISLNRLSELVFRYLHEELGYDGTLIADSIIEDIIKINGRKIPGFLRDYASHIPDLRKKEMSKSHKRQVLRD